MYNIFRLFISFNLLSKESVLFLFLGRHQTPRKIMDSSINTPL